MRTIHHWRILYRLWRARSARKKARRDDAWEAALGIADADDGWLVLDCPGKRLGGRHPIEITRVSDRGVIYGRKHQQNGKVGSERRWGRR